MNTNRNIPYNYNVKDIDWPGLKAVGISKEQLKRTATLTCCCKARNQKSSR